MLPLRFLVAVGSSVDAGFVGRGGRFVRRRCCADDEGVQSAGALRQHAQLMHAVRQPAQADLLPEGEGVSVAADRLDDCAVQFEVEIAEAGTLRVDHGHVCPAEVDRHLRVGRAADDVSAAAGFARVLHEPVRAALHAVALRFNDGRAGGGRLECGFRRRFFGRRRAVASGVGSALTASPASIVPLGRAVGRTHAQARLVLHVDVVEVHVGDPVGWSRHQLQPDVAPTASR